ncbi:hypothetical protein BJV85_003378 [Clostridium acetobutylicum]|uniref:hypothetical protein n=1 Tax=Clostridium TaxID=1485 RepID=UPI0002F7D770|nr:MULTISPECIES: hypothetical protein [Clostridium]MBC2392521.1 hypothetical protein [Clostridium acetobutylicum]MBC2583815.1 hypothetical protein [Clostridium acetobutylicum]NOV89439.1 hypothetical protein [Clostridium acetobutylicum]NOW16031.1 hypothetical protein [Clostridium acetobutylicum]NRY57710.1 hypothetical protein [Clostridium acetobutylicum]
MHFFKWLCGLIILILMSAFIFNSILEGIYFFVIISTFVFIGDILVKRMRSF